MASSPDLARLADDVLIRLIAMRRQDALDTLYARYNRLVFGLALHMLRHDHAAAEEVTLDVFVSVWQHASTYRPDKAQVTTWLTSLARHRCIDRLRALRVRPEGYLTDLAQLDQTATQDAAAMDAEWLVQRERVQTALQDLPAEQRQVLFLAYYQGLSQSEMAAALGLPLGTVKTRIRLAMQKLRTLLESEI